MPKMKVVMVKAANLGPGLGVGYPGEEHEIPSNDATFLLNNKLAAEPGSAEAKAATPRRGPGRPPKTE